MTRPHGMADGRPVDLIGQPLAAGRGSRSGVGITRKEIDGMAKAEKNGRYRLGTSIFRVFEGDTIPEGAEMVDEPDTRKKGPAPENRAEGAAPESRKRTTKKADES